MKVKYRVKTHEDFQKVIKANKPYLFHVEYKDR